MRAWRTRAIAPCGALSRRPSIWAGPMIALSSCARSSSRSASVLARLRLVQDLGRVDGFLGAAAHEGDASDEQFGGRLDAALGQGETRQAISHQAHAHAVLGEAVAQVLGLQYREPAQRDDDHALGPLEFSGELLDDHSGDQVGHGFNSRRRSRRPAPSSC